ncbi:MAG: hypothetical protein IPN68_14565 [Bacteroidetes bacterium]|nr:hypothetical protein [Bacteroidota bacterium]
MKKLIKLTGCLALAAIMGLSSCVKTEIAPEVAQIRQAQVSKLNAEIQQILANTTRTTVETRQLRMMTTFDSLMRAFTLKQNAASFAGFQGHIDLQVQQELVLLEGQKLLYAQAVAAYDKFINEGTFAANVASYLTSYNTANSELITLYGSRVTKTAALEKEKLLLVAVTGGNLSWDVIKERLEYDLSLNEAKLAFMNSALADLQSVLADPSITGALKADLENQVFDLNSQWDSLTTVSTKATAELTAIGSKITAYNALITVYDALVADTVTKLSTIATKNTAITNANTALVPLNTDLALKNANLTADKNDNTAAMTAYNAKLALYNTAVTNDNNALDLVASKTVLKTIADNNLAADPTNPTLIAAATAATALTNASTAQGLTATALTSATTAKDAALQVVVGIAGTFTVPVNPSTLYSLNQSQIAVTGFANPLTAPSPTSAQGLVNAQLVIISDANDDIAVAEAAIAADIVKIEANQANYDIAMEEIVTLDEAKAPLQALVTNTTLALAVNVASKTELNSVITILATEVTTIETAISGKVTAIRALELTIAGQEKSIADNAIDKAAAEATIVKLEAELADLNIQITDKEALVAYWKKMLDNEIAAQSR